MPEISETSEENITQPIKFKEEFIVTGHVGMSMPFGSNLQHSFESGTSIKVNIGTPFGFSLGKREFKISGGIDMLTLPLKENSGSSATDDYGLINVSAKMSTKLLIFNVHLGVGMGSASAYELTVPSFSGGLTYQLPIEGLLENLNQPALNGVDVSLFLEIVELTSSPLENGTSDLMNMGLSVSYPVLF